MEIILASASPRRRELLGKIVKDFKVIVSGEEEKSLKTVPEEICCELALQKAKAVAKNNCESIVIGADTIVVLNGKILGKPQTVEDNVNYLESLSGTSHYVLTGYAIIYKDRLYSGVEKTEVKFRELSREEITAYCQNGNGLDKAGGYGIQDGDFVFEIIGDYDNVVGFPTRTIEKVLKNIIRSKV